MRNLAVLVTILAVIGFGGCKKPGSGSTGTLTMKFNPLFGTNKLVRYATYTDGSTFYNFQDFKFYMSHLKLVYTNGSMVEVNPLAYFSLDDSADLAVTMTVPEGSYKGIQFNIGLDSLQDAMTPSGDTSSPISANNNTWWTPQQEFVFVEMDGTADSMANSSHGFAYHVGTNPYYTSTPQLSGSFSVTGDSKTTLILNAQVMNMFYGTSSAINIITNNTTMTTEGNAYELNLAHTFINDFSQIFSFQQ